MKWAFTFLLCIHGVIHLIGYVKAFFSSEIEKQVLGVPKLIGALWLVCFTMFIFTAASFFNNKKWFYLAFIAVCLSQVLIILVWKEAKYGSIFNIIILLASISSFGSYQFNKMVQKESIAVFQNIETINSSVITKKDISHLPEIVQKWMTNSGVIGKHVTMSVRLKQKGQMKTKLNGKWMPFTAMQYFNAVNPAFVWTTKVDAMFGINMIGRDQLINGEAAMLIKVASIFTVVNQSNNEKINTGAMIRFLAETCWFPSGALNDYIIWEAIGDTSAKAILTIDNKSISGIFKFNTEGDILAFETNRYFGGNEDAKLEKWTINMVEYKVFDGMKIPSKCQVIWKLKTGDFNWLNLEITDIEYNTLKPYENK